MAMMSFPRPELPITNRLAEEYLSVYPDASIASEEDWDRFRAWVDAYPDQELAARSREELVWVGRSRAGPCGVLGGAADNFMWVVVFFALFLFMGWVVNRWIKRGADAFDFFFGLGCVGFSCAWLVLCWEMLGQGFRHRPK